MPKNATSASNSASRRSSLSKTGTSTGICLRKNFVDAEHFKHLSSSSIPWYAMKKIIKAYRNGATRRIQDIRGAGYHPMPVKRTPTKTHRPSEVLSPGRLPFAEDAEARRSRRTRVDMERRATRTMCSRRCPGNSKLMTVPRGPATPVVPDQMNPRSHFNAFEQPEARVGRRRLVTGNGD
ncbi:hypothetical protein HPB47_018707 [Ixodes persulcatus]|uniref:Uncharacterized protein n=1 Tax=Ixodes persulcatus TaxID=34615 RepID=A0AC60QK84_IXOPE|nr:hypothetical protein HPB47_018707 [Ixodes persulcatus]